MRKDEFYRGKASMDDLRAFMVVAEATQTPSDLVEEIIFLRQAMPSGHPMKKNAAGICIFCGQARHGRSRTNDKMLRLP